MRRTSGRWGVVLIAVLMVLFSSVSLAQEQQPLPPERLKAISDRVNQLEDRLNDYNFELERLRGIYVQPLKRAGGMEYVRKRFKQGEGLFRVGDYEHAAIIFSDLIDNELLKKDDALRYKVLYYLAESFYQRRSYLMCKKYFEEVVEFGAQWPHYNDAVIRLIEVAINVNDIDTARRYYKMLRGGDVEVADMIKYAYAKYLYNVGKRSEAKEIFSEIREGSTKYLQALYFLGVIAVDEASSIPENDVATRDAKLVEAQQIFERVMNFKPRNKEEKLITQLAQINVGRILYERSLMLGDDEKSKEEARKLVSRAMALYRKIPPESPFYDQAYYELVWIYVRRGEYEDALNALEIMLGSMPDSLYTPEAQLTKAELLARLHKFKKAKKEYMNVVKSWQGTVDLLEELIKITRGKRAADIHQEIMKRVRQLPLVAFKWLQQEEQVKRALELEKEIEELKDKLKETRKVLDKLVQASKQQSKARVFPVLREGREAGLNLANSVVGLHKELVKLSNEIVAGRLDEKTRKEYLEAQKRRRQLEAAYNKLPKTAKQRYEAKKKKLQRIQQLAELVYRLQLQLEGLNRKIDELIERKERMRANPHTSRRFLARVERQLAEERDNIKSMLSEIEKMNTEIERDIQAIKMGVGDSKEEQIRREYETALERERAILKRVREKMTKQELDLFTRIEALKEKASELEGAINLYFADLETLGQEWMQAFKKDIERQQVAIKSWQNDLVALGKDVSAAASEIVVANIRNVRKHFYEIVLDADVGLLEITWQRWSEVADKLEALKKEQRQEERELKQMFEEQKDIVNTGTSL